MKYCSFEILIGRANNHQLNFDLPLIINQIEKQNARSIV